MTTTDAQARILAELLRLGAATATTLAPVPSPASRGGTAKSLYALEARGLVQRCGMSPSGESRWDLTEAGGAVRPRPPARIERRKPAAGTLRLPL